MAQKNPNKPGFREAIRCFCFQCCGDMLDGLIDCKSTKCPLYQWQPFRKLAPNLAWREEGSHLQKNRRALREKYRLNAKGVAPDPVEDDEPDTSFEEESDE